MVMNLQATIENCLIMALIWSVGGTVDEAGRTQFNLSLRSFLKGEWPEKTRQIVFDLKSPYIVSEALHSKDGVECSRI